ncbi:SDR family NAD(P)-dependent oxidoreductase, partial [Streptococcus pneumoniae]|uniref:SDR family NAD(P)-dependent oxidoreductase n=1 Tax=Streptococcus pneumoniae TaxID=1313 RepID=UPI000B2D215B
MIFTYNKEHVGDVLMVIVKNSGDAKLNVERKGKVARVFLKENGETVAWNIFEVSSLFEIAERGQVFLSDEQVARLNQELQAEGFTEEIVNDKEPKFVVGEIVEMVAHPDSDHLNICQVAVASDKIVHLETIGRIDILVNNAGLALDLAPYQDYEELDMLTMLDTNVKGLMAVTRCFLPAMIKVNQGHIINMGSTAGIYAYA